MSARGFAFPVVAFVLVLFERVRKCSEDWCASVRARRREERWTARSSAEGGSPKMKNFIKKKIKRAIESWPRRKPCVKERLVLLVGSSSKEVRGPRTRSLGRRAVTMAAE